MEKTTLDCNQQVVVGDGSASCFAVAHALEAGHEVVWLAGTGSRLLPILPFYGRGKSVESWMQLARAFDLETGDLQNGNFLKEFRNKSFKDPVWIQAPTPDDRIALIEESLWEPERQIVCELDAQIGLSSYELEEKLRQQILKHPKVHRIEKDPVLQIQWKADPKHLVLGTGVKVPFSRLTYADRWDALSSLPEVPTFFETHEGRKIKPQQISKLDSVSALQMVFHHRMAVAAEFTQGFFIELHKDAGESLTRHVWGYFTEGGWRSHWTVLLTAEESADHHEVAKKLRKAKQTLARVFSSPEWIPEGVDFLTVVGSEQVRFESSILFCGGDSNRFPLIWPGTDGKIIYAGDQFGFFNSHQAGPVGEARSGEVTDSCVF